MRSDRHLVLAGLALAVTSAGCNLIINPNQYVGSGRDTGPGGNDGGPGVDANADAQTDAGHANTPPIVLGVGLDQYDPNVTETVHAQPGPVFDADGDHTTLHYQWFLNGTAASGATTAAFDTTSHMAGDHLRVEAWANDGTVDGPHVSAGDITIAANVTRWRQRLPNNGNDNLPRMFWDAPNNRVIRIIEGGVWEYAITPSGMRIARLPASGPAPADDQQQIAALDPPHHRIVVYTQSDTTHLYSLDLSHRGAEVWTRTSVGGSAPSIEILATVFFDPGTQRVWVMGGFHDSMGAVGGLHSLDVSSPGAETWSTHTTSGATLPPMFGEAPVVDPMTPSRVYLFGGVTTPVSARTFVNRDHVLQLDLTANTVTVTESMVPLAAGGWGSAAAYDAMSQRIVVYGGLNVFGAVAMPLGLALYDMTAGTSTTMPASATHAVTLGSLTPDANHPGHLVSAAIGGDLFNGGESYIDVDDVTTTAPATVLGQDQRPNSLWGASGRLTSGVIQVIDGYEKNATATNQWSIDTATWLWTPYTTMPDSVLGGQAPVRFGVVGETAGSTFNPPPIFEIGGLRDMGVLADMEAWELDIAGRWIDHHLMAGQSPPTAVTGAVVWRGSCGNTTVGVYGGEDGTGTISGVAANLNCSGSRNCMWASGMIDSGRSYAALATGYQHVYVFGGRLPGGSSANDIVSINGCFSTPMLDTITVSGAPPSPRLGHSVSGVYDSMSNLASFLTFGGEDGATTFFDTYRFTFAGGMAGTWSPITLTDGVHPSARTRHLAFWDDVNSRLIVLGGSIQSNGGGSIGDAWELLIRN